VRTAVITWFATAVSPAVGLAAIALLVCACGDADGPRAFSPDVAPADAANGCVLDDGPSVVTHRVARGETLTSIARELYGDSVLWPEIARANPDLVGRDGSVQTGALLVIPFVGR